MNKYYHIPGDDETKALQENFFSPLLENGQVEGLLLPKKTDEGSVLQALIHDRESLAGISPFAPLMLSSGAKAVSNLTFKGLKKKVGALLRPCEIRALVELVKLKQVDREQVLLMGTDCLGTLEVQDYKESYQEEGPHLFTRYQEALRAGDGEGFSFREACRFCAYPAGEGSDIQLITIGGEKGKMLLEAVSPEGQKVLEELGLEEVSPPPGREGLLEAIRKKKKEDFQKEKEAFLEKQGDLSQFFREFAYCLNCKNCRTACPICYCRECVFTTLVFEHDANKYVKWARRKGAIRMPTDTILFHLTRLNHMGLSCVGCGLCESACPVDIPLLKIFKIMGEEAQQLFSYIPGAHGEEPIPLTTYQEEELEPR